MGVVKIFSFGHFEIYCHCWLEPLHDVLTPELRHIIRLCFGPRPSQTLAVFVQFLLCPGDSARGMTAGSTVPKLLMTGYLLTYFFQTKNVRWKRKKKKRFKNENTVEVETAGVFLQSTPVSDSARHVDSLSNERKHLEDSLLYPNRGCWAREEGKMSLPKFSRRMQSSVGDRASPDSSSPCLMHIPLFVYFL